MWGTNVFILPHDGSKLSVGLHITMCHIWPKLTKISKSLQHKDGWRPVPCNDARMIEVNWPNRKMRVFRKNIGGSFVLNNLKQISYKVSFIMSTIAAMTDASCCLLTILRKTIIEIIWCLKYPESDCWLRQELNESQCSSVCLSVCHSHSLSRALNLHLSDSVFLGQSYVTLSGLS